MTLDHAKLAATGQWLMAGAPAEGDNPGLPLERFCRRLSDAGFMLSRVNVFIQTLHPDVFGISMIWRPAETKVNLASFGTDSSDAYNASPLALMYASGREIRLRLDDPTNAHFPIVADLKAEGATDYVLLPLHFSDGAVHATTWATDRPGGYTEEDLDALRSLIAPFARVVEIISLRRMASILLGTYVGDRAGPRILQGHIRRGFTESMNAAIWLSDMRGFTALSDRLPAPVMVDVLNCYFDCQVPAIRDRGGDVLKFMGDGLLAVFPIEGDAADAASACRRALGAAFDARERIHALCYPHDEGQLDGFRFGVALHIGEVMSGNIGGGRALNFDDGFINLPLDSLAATARATSRLDFTCIGPAVNLAARLEKIAAGLGRTIVASAEFAHLCQADWSPLGEHPIRGLAAPSRVFGLADEDALSC